MPVVELSYKRVQGLVGRSKKEISAALPYLGLDIESEEGDAVRIEYSPNRPDYSTEYGISLGLQGLLGAKKGMIRLEPKKSRYSISARPAVSKLRPYITAVAATGGKVTDHMIRQLMSLQEDLHAGLGRGRTKASIGIHDLSRIEFPLEYGAAPRTHRFVPLGGDSEMDVSEVLASTQQGRDYGGLLAGKAVPVLSDAQNRTISLPPVINSEHTTLRPGAGGLLVEVTGTSKDVIEDVLAVVCVTLKGAGFCLESVSISGAGNHTPKLSSRTVSVPLSLINSTLGLSLSSKAAISALKKSRLDAAGAKTIRCMVPAYRFDIFGPMDLVEEAALGYGIDKLGPELRPSAAIGSRDPGSEMLGTVSRVMTGLGYMEALNSSLAGGSVLHDMMGRDSSGSIPVLDSKSGSSVLRDSLLPGLLECLSRNIHEPYPQKLFETGTVFAKGVSVSESMHLCGISSHDKASYTEAKSALQAALSAVLGAKCSTVPGDVPGLAGGRAAAVKVDGKEIGVVGEVSKDVLDSFKLRVPAAAFEIRLDVPCRQD